MKSAIILGAGSWGTALAVMLAERGLKVQFWGRDAALMNEIQTTRCNSRYMPNLLLPDELTATSKMEDLQPADLVVFVVPSKVMRSGSARSTSAKSHATTSPIQRLERPSNHIEVRKALARFQPEGSGRSNSLIRWRKG